jgi:hypothetical protein
MSLLPHKFEIGMPGAFYVTSDIQYFSNQYISLPCTLIEHQQQLKASTTQVTISALLQSAALTLRVFAMLML